MKGKNGLSDKIFRFRLQILKSSSGYHDSPPYFLRIFPARLGKGTESEHFLKT